MSIQNPCAKRVTPEKAYEVWQSADGSWTYFVLKKYQSPEKEVENLYAKWYCMVKSPAMTNGEYGDIYVAEVKRGTRKLDHNPLTQAESSAKGQARYVNRDSREEENGSGAKGVLP